MACARCAVKASLHAFTREKRSTERRREILQLGCNDAHFLAIALHELGLKAKSYTGGQVRVLTDSAFTKARILDMGIVEKLMVIFSLETVTSPVTLRAVLDAARQ